MDRYKRRLRKTPLPIASRSRAWVALLYLRHPSSTSPDEDELDNGYYYTVGMDYNAPTTDNATTMGTKIAGSKEHISYLTSVYLARLKIMYPSNDWDSDASIVDQDFGLTPSPTYSLSTLHSTPLSPPILSPTAQSSTTFRSAISSSTLVDPSPLLIYLIETNYTDSPPPFNSVALSTYLLTLKMVQNLYLPTSSFSPLIPDLCLLLSLPPVPTSSSSSASSQTPSNDEETEDGKSNMEDVETLPPPAVLAAMSKIINGRAQTEQDFFLPSPTPQSHLSWCKTFSTLISRLYPKTYLRMLTLSALSPPELSPIFERFFIPLLPISYVHRIFDIYLLEGSKAIFRFGVALVGCFKTKLKKVDFNRPGVFWWDQVRRMAHDPGFTFDDLLNSAFGTFGSTYRRQRKFPTRGYLSRVTAGNVKWGRETWEGCKVEGRNEAKEMELTKMRRGGPRGPEDKSYPEATKLATGTSGLRYNLAQWVPPKIQGRKMEMLYSTECDGRGLDMLFQSCSFTSCGPTITLVEVLSTGAVLGLYTSGPWRSIKKVYGDGTCFVCKFSPDPKAYKWEPKSGSTSSDDDGSGVELAVNEQFMTTADGFIAMGANPTGGAAIRINQELTEGWTERTDTFGNEPLVEGGMFEIGRVECYRFASIFAT